MSFDRLKIIAAKSVSVSVDQTALWQLCTRDDLSRLYFEQTSSKHYSKNFMSLVNTVVESRVQSNVLSTEKIEDKGFVLVYDPYGSLFDGFSSEQTNGFFDDADAPPPEFWLGCIDSKLISFIPNRFAGMLDLAFQGMADLCLTKYDDFDLFCKANAKSNLD